MSAHPPFVECIGAQTHISVFGTIFFQYLVLLKSIFFRLRRAPKQGFSYNGQAFLTLMHSTRNNETLNRKSARKKCFLRTTQDFSIDSFDCVSN